MLKQEETLSELDQSIDEWVSRLEHAENRRTRVRQKLLEHVAAALMSQKPDSIPAQHTEEPTPPGSPENIDSPLAVNRRDVESIKIYADAEVYALFVDIEKEMEMMVDTKPLNPSPRQDTSELI
jgi:hypothetical protein